jgi:hypothetical protein
VEKGGRFLDGSTRAERAVATYQSVLNVEVRKIHPKDKTESVRITLKDFPTVHFYGTKADSQGIFLLTTCRILSSSTAGWNDVELDIAGQGIVLEGYGFQIYQPLELLQVSGGAILHNTVHFDGEEALNQLQARFERIQSLTAWMHSNQNLPAFDSYEAFESFWLPVLIPETLPAQARPSYWTTYGSEFRTASDISWNVRYTEAFFPEELRDLRNSGTLLRDWEEASRWIYVAYRWNDIVTILTQPQLFVH